jgi:hypothetical protein
MAYNPILLSDILKTYFEFGALTTVDINSQKVFQGVTFGATKRLTYPKSPGLVNIVFDGTAVTKEKLVLLPVNFNAAGAGPIHIDIYFGGTYGDDGTVIECFNRDNESLVTCDSEIRLNPTITSKGTKLPGEFIILSNGTPAVATLGGEVIDNFISLLRKDGKYLIELSNQDTVTAAVGWIGLDFFEVDES